MHSTCALKTLQPIRQFQMTAKLAPSFREHRTNTFPAKGNHAVGFFQIRLADAPWCTIEKHGGYSRSKRGKPLSFESSLRLMKMPGAAMLRNYSERGGDRGKTREEALANI